MLCCRVFLLDGFEWADAINVVVIYYVVSEQVG